MATMLTSAAVRKLKPSTKRTEVHDAGSRGLTLVIEPSGHKPWKMRFRDRRGKLVRLTLGAVDLDGQERLARTNNRRAPHSRGRETTRS